MKKRFYLEINYDFYSDEEEEELNEMLDEIADTCMDYTSVKSVEILPKKIILENGMIQM